MSFEEKYPFVAEAFGDWELFTTKALAEDGVIINEARPTSREYIPLSILAQIVKQHKDKEHAMEKSTNTLLAPIGITDGDCDAVAIATHTKETTKEAARLASTEYVKTLNLRNINLKGELRTNG